MKTIRIISSVLILSIIIIILFYNNVYAEMLALNIISDKEEVKVGEEIRIRVNWNTVMQAADFYLNYDSNKLEYIKSDIDDVFISNNPNEGKIKTAWVSMDDSGKTSIEYFFKVKNDGQLKFSTSVNGGFATENIETPEQYNEGELIIGTKDNNSIIYIIMGIIIICIILLIYISKKKKK